MALSAVAMMAQEPVITFDKTTHDFGKVPEAGKISTVFTFKNEGMAPLIVTKVKASCGCTTPDWTKEPVEPGQTGEITVTYNTSGRPGGFSKTVTVTSNATEPTKMIYIKGEVEPKQVQPANKFTVAVGQVNMKTKTLDLGTIKKGEIKSGELEFANQTKEEHTIELATNAADAGFISQVTLASAKPDEIGKFIFALDTKKAKLYGKVEFYAYVVIDGKKIIDDAHKLTVKADIVEDFSNLSLIEKQNAPIIEVGNEYSVGVIPQGKHVKFSFPVKNNGANPLEIRRVYSPDSKISAKAPKAIKNGKKGAVILDVNSKDLQPGKYSRQVLVISNDYKSPQRKVTIKWEVQ